MNELQREYKNFMRRVQKTYPPIIEKTLENIASGMEWKEAIDKAFESTYFLKTTEDLTVKAVMGTSQIGLGSQLTLNTGLAKDYYLYTEFDKGITLSNTIWAGDYQRAVKQTVGEYLKNQGNVVSLSKKIGSTATPKAKLPKYIQELLSATKDDKDLQKKINKVLKEANRLTDNGYPQNRVKQEYRKIAKAVQDNNPIALQRAVENAYKKKCNYITSRVSRTEMARAYGMSVYRKVHEDDGIIAVRWVLSSGHPVVDICDHYHEVDAFGMGDGVYPARSLPTFPAHPNCVIGETHIESHTSINKAFNSVYSGTVIKITLANGNSVVVTSNHPVLTQRGWVKAESIRNTDYCINTIFNNKRNSIGDPNNNYGNTSAYEICNSLAMNSSVMSTRVPVSPEDFHGDGAFFDEDVTIIDTNSLLDSSINTHFDKPFIDGDFTRGDVDSFSSSSIFNGDSPVYEIGDIKLATSYGVVSFGGDFGEKLLSSIFASPELFALFNSPLFNSVFSKYPINNTARNNKALSYRVNAFSFDIPIDDDFTMLNHVTPLFNSALTTSGSRISLDDVIHRGWVNSDLLSNFPVTNSLTMEFHNVVSVLATHVDNLPVYNFETDITNIYKGNGVVLHNCLCSFVSVREDPDSPQKNKRYSNDRTLDYLENMDEKKRGKIIGVANAKGSREDWDRALKDRGWNPNTNKRMTSKKVIEELK